MGLIVFFTGKILDHVDVTDLCDWSWNQRPDLSGLFYIRNLLHRWPVQMAFHLFFIYLVNEESTRTE